MMHEEAQAAGVLTSCLREASRDRETSPKLATDESLQHPLKLPHADAHVFNDAPIEHRRWYVPIALFALKLAKLPKDDALHPRQPITNIRHPIAHGDSVAAGRA